MLGCSGSLSARKMIAWVALIDEWLNNFLFLLAIKLILIGSFYRKMIDSMNKLEGDIHEWDY